MKKISENKLKLILEKHLDWLNNKKGGKRADLSDIDLSGLNFRGVNFSGANLSFANFCGANFHGANFRGANCRDANFSGATFSGANLGGANFNDADLSNIIVNEATSFYYLQCPEKGSFTGFKKCEFIDKEVIVELLIPKNAKRSSATTRKCRCDKAKVIAFYDLDGNKLDDLKSARSIYDYNFIYEINKTVKVDNFDENRWNECSSGIHFFMSFKEAVDYQL